MFTNHQNLNKWRLIGLCLFLALFMVGSVSASTSVAEPGKAMAQQAKIPSSYYFEGPTLSGVLSDAAAVMQNCNCQHLVTSFAYERTIMDWHGLTIHLDWVTPDAPLGIWEEIPFQGTSLPAVLREVAKFMQHDGCESAVRDVRYARAASTPNDQRRLTPVHIVYLVRESPSPC
ncbi:MAG: hypothetical protein KF770_19760 [Anaerolineae bacterium]|nr:hypothetical protein [Anaerolineae bacterium]